MIYISKNKILTILIFFSIATLQYNQLKIVPLPTVTRPIAQIFIFILFFILVWWVYIKRTSNINLQKYYFQNSDITKWLLLFVVIIIYSIFTIIIYNNFIDSIKFLINIIFAFLFYWYGYTRLGIDEERFNNYNILFSLPILFIGLVEVSGFLISNFFYTLISTLRDMILSINLDNKRLHLLFSEPSFMGTYLLFIHYLFYHSKRYYKYRKAVTLLLILFILFGKSLNTMIVVLAFLGSYYLFINKTKVLSKVIIILIALFLLAIITYLLFKSRLTNITYDPSAYIRFLHLVVLTKMFTDSYGLGMGFGSFSDYFVNYLNNNFIPIDTAELNRDMSGDVKVVPYSIFFSILGQTGIFGIFAFMFIFRKMFYSFNPYRHYYIALFVSTISALPWGLPFIWVLLGMLDKKIEERKYEHIACNRG